MNNTKNTTVLLVSENPHTQIGGIENDILHLGNMLIEKGVNIRYLSAKELSGIYLFNKKIVSNNAIKKRILEINPDIIHVYGFSSFFINQILSLAKKTLPYIKLIYTPCYHPFAHHTRPLFAFLFFNSFLKTNLQNVDVLIALTASEKDFFSHYYDPKKIKIIPNGVETQPCLPKIKPLQHRLLFIGRNDHNKRLDFLISQKDFFMTHKINCEIVTDRLLPSNEVFTYHTKLNKDDLVNLYHKCSILVVPSRYESFSIVSLEAMTFGNPILISDNVQFKTFFPSDNLFRSVFKYNDIEDFQSKLITILNMTPQEYRMYSEQNINFSASFDWKIVFDEIYKCYKE